MIDSCCGGGAADRAIPCSKDKGFPSSFELNGKRELWRNTRRGLQWPERKNSCRCQGSPYLFLFLLFFLESCACVRVFFFFLLIWLIDWFILLRSACRSGEGFSSGPLHLFSGGGEILSASRESERPLKRPLWEQNKKTKSLTKGDARQSPLIKGPSVQGRKKNKTIEEREKYWQRLFDLWDPSALVCHSRNDAVGLFPRVHSVLLVLLSRAKLRIESLTTTTTKQSKTQKENSFFIIQGTKALIKQSEEVQTLQQSFFGGRTAESKDLAVSYC